MLKWLITKMKLKDSKSLNQEQEYCKERTPADGIEKSLWEIKDVYDLPTEEVAMTVRTKRKNLQYMHKILKNNDNKLK